MRLRHLDGLRGIAALVVAVGHMLRVYPAMFSTSFGEAPHAQQVVWLASAGSQMVWLFLMVSAFSLVYSEDARRARGRMPSPWRVFLRRRAWRIVPLYYVAVMFGVVVAVAIPAALMTGLVGGLAFVKPTGGGLLAQLIFISNVDPDLMMQGNAALWSIPFEVQLYLILPGVAWLLRGWRGFAPVFGALALAEILVTSTMSVPVALVGFFLLGAVAARVRVPRRYGSLLTVCGVGLFAVALTGMPTFGTAQRLACAVGFFLLLVGMAAAPGARWNVCEARPFAALGARSYSLYAMHYPVTLAAFAVLTWAGLAGYAVAVGTVVVAGAVTAVVVEVTYRRVELPSLALSRRAPARPPVCAVTPAAARLG